MQQINNITSKHEAHAEEHRPTATYLLSLTIQTANADSRPTNYLRRGNPKGEEGHGGRVEGHHVGDEVSVDVERYTPSEELKGM